ncbi:TPA: phosphatidylserine decarboxylase [Candidatus Woesearchaeota archaeon]|nr:phosphatidylserine decarboxylase [Candidatus Woesearchaeota archaeon]
MLSVVVWVLIGIILLVALFLLQFYRDPKRAIPRGSAIVSPADGRVMRIFRTSGKKVTVEKGLMGRIRTTARDVGKDCWVVSIFMSPIDAHINRAPIAGTIVSVRHTPGKFFAAYDLEKSMMNEKNEIVIRGRNTKVKVVQIAGFLARRIICRVKKGQSVAKGERIGQIALGSQATVIMPARAKVIVKEGQHVKAGSSVIAEAP